MDRVPLEQAVDKVETPPQEPAQTNEAVPEQGLSEMQDLNEMSIMFGFDEPGFDGLGKEAELIYRWGREVAGEPGIAALNTVKRAIQESGINATGRELIIKLHRWVKLDNKAIEIQKQKELLHG